MDNYAVDTGRVATINASTGALTAVAPGYSIIRGRKVLNSQDYWVTFVLYVSTDVEAEWLDAFIRNAPSVKYMDIQIQYALSHRNETQADACAKGIHNGSIQTDPSKKTFPAPKLTAQIHEGMTYEEVTDILGLPQYQMVRSLRVFAYKLNNGTEFAIYYSQNTNGHLL